MTERSGPPGQGLVYWSSDHAPTAPRRRGRRPRSGRERGPPAIPIVDSRHVIVAWTEEPPFIDQGRLRHPVAERLLGGSIFCTQVALSNMADILRAGGPSGWNGAWRCMALCRQEHARGFEHPDGAPPIGNAAPSDAADAEDRAEHEGR